VADLIALIIIEVVVVSIVVFVYRRLPDDDFG